MTGTGRPRTALGVVTYRLTSGELAPQDGATVARFLLACLRTEVIDTCSRLYDLLRQQADGNHAAAGTIRIQVQRICGAKVFRDPDLTSQQVRGLELLLLEWKEMFSFSPGRPEGLAPLLKLVELVGRTPQFEATDIYGTSEWKQLIDLRGPVETVQILDCESCHTKYPRMGMSGFLDLVDLLCANCGGIVFRSTYSAPGEATCSCGGIAKLGCPACGARKGRVVTEMSPYQYFSGHRMVRDEAT